MGNSISTRTKKQLVAEAKEYKTHAYIFGILFAITAVIAIGALLQLSAYVMDDTPAKLNECEYNLDMRIEGLRYKSGQVGICNYVVQFLDDQFNLTPKVFALDNATLQRFRNEMTRIAELYINAVYERMEVDSRYYDPNTGESVYVRP